MPPELRAAVTALAGKGSSRRLAVLDLPPAAQKKARKAELRVSQGDVRRANTRRLYTFGPVDGMKPTRDPFDRAHDVRDRNGDLVVAPVAPRMRSVAPAPRLYAACHMTGAGVSFETAMDEQHEREMRLLAWGLEVGGRANMADQVRTAMGVMAARLSPEGMRSRLRPRTTQRDAVTGEACAD